jgi:hypothetical protein
MRHRSKIFRNAIINYVSHAKTRYVLLTSIVCLIVLTTITNQVKSYRLFYTFIHVYQTARTIMVKKKKVSDYFITYVLF